MVFRQITNIFVLDATIKELKRLGIIKEKHKRKKAEK